MRIPQLLLSSFLLVATASGTAVLAAAAPPAASQPALRTAEGSVVAVDAAAKSLTVRGKHADLTFVWDAATTVVGRKGPQYLKAGSRVSIQYATAGAVRQAKKITVLPPPRRAAEQG